MRIWPLTSHPLHSVTSWSLHLCDLSFIVIVFRRWIRPWWPDLWPFSHCTQWLPSLCLTLWPQFCAQPVGISHQATQGRVQAVFSTCTRQLVPACTPSLLPTANSYWWGKCPFSNVLFLWYLNVLHNLHNPSCHSGIFWKGHNSISMGNYYIKYSKSCTIPVVIYFHTATSWYMLSGSVFCQSYQAIGQGRFRAEGKVTESSFLLLHIPDLHWPVSFGVAW